MHYEFYKNCQFDGAVLDRIYQEAFGYQRDGVFVEVGASNGLDYSNTWGLARLGWRGVYVEPVPALAAACRRNHREHAGVATVEAAVADRDDGNGSIWVIPPWGTATLNRAAAADISGRSQAEPVEIPCRFARLDTLLAGMGWVTPGFDLLVIDVDFGEVAVLRGFTLGRWRPKLVMIELHESTPEAPTFQPHSEAAREMAKTYFAEGYEKVYADSINTIYRREG